MPAGARPVGMLVESATDVVGEIMDAPPPITVLPAGQVTMTPLKASGSNEL